MRYRDRFLLFVFAFVVLSASAMFAQELDVAPAGTARLTFDVISIHPHQGPRLFLPCNSQANPGGDGYKVYCMQLSEMIAFIYKIPARQIVGIPAGFLDESFNIEAKTEGVYSLDQLHVMFQNMLADRFGLKFHTEKREGNIYALSVAKGGVKMKQNTDAFDLKTPQIQGNWTSFTGTRVPMNRLCWQLALLLRYDERPVINMTGLTGNYDFTLDFQPELSPASEGAPLPPGFLDRPKIPTAVREQLGLKLTAQKGPVTYFVVDRLSEPTEN